MCSRCLLTVAGVTQSWRAVSAVARPAATQCMTPPGDTFVDRGDRIHTARNEGAVQVDFWATCLVPGERNAPFRIDAPVQDDCGF